MTKLRAVEDDRRDTFTAVLLEHFTPVDASVRVDLDQVAIAGHVRDLVKRLGIAAELTAPGHGADLIDIVMQGRQEPAELLAALDAILEFGALPADLSAAQRDKAARAEIRQEVLHFDRIMDLDSLRDNRFVLKSRRDFMHDEGLIGAAERLLVLVYERLVLRGKRTLQWQDLSNQPQNLVTLTETGGKLERTRYPVVHVAATGGSTQIANLLRQFERYAVRHPLAVALGLVDYGMFVEGLAPQEFVAVTFHRDGSLNAELWAAGSASWVLLCREGFIQRVLARGALDGSPAGADRSRYARQEVAVPPGAWLLLALDGGRIAALPDLGRSLNRRDRNGRIDLVANLNPLLADAPHVLAKPTNVPSLGAPRTRDSDDVAAALCRDAVDTASGVVLSIECGHVHADREVGPAQLRGLDLGARMVDTFRRCAGDHGVWLDVDVTPMVDDDHVLNRFNFSQYRKLFEERHLVVGDLILESSPLTRAMAHDVLRRALQLDGEGFALRRLGRNLYLEAEGLRLELVEDLEGEMRNGCVMFEVGLVMYRAARVGLVRTFQQVTGIDVTCLHGLMADRYDAAADPVERERLRAEFEQTYRDEWDHVRTTVNHTPFLDRYLAISDKRRQEQVRTVVLNVIEDYYRPQQEKVLQLARLLQIPLPLQALFFSPHGHGLQRLETPCLGAGSTRSMGA